MCGIAGLYLPGANASGAAVAGMLDRIAHRGPDGRGLVESGPVALGHVRLSILDLTDRAAQPMASHDGRFLLTYNGEVYNFAELRTRLEAENVALGSTGDTEVLLEHLARFGLRDTLPRIEGFFAFALWDRVEQTLVLARDRLGKKSLYWCARAGEVRFASEQKALVDGQTRPDLTTLDAMLLGFPANWGRTTVFEDIEALEPGTVAVFRHSATPVRERWFSIDDLVDPVLRRDLDRGPEEEVVERFEEAFRQSLGYRMVSDVPVASLVSGGVDSCLVTALASEREPRPAMYHADVLADSERPAAEALAAHLGGSLHVASISDEWFLANVARATWYNDEPLTYHLNAVPFMGVCDLAGANGVKVLLSGEGSDELFLGYPHLGLAPYMETIASFKRTLRTLASRVAPRVMDQIWPSAATSYNVMLRELVSRGMEPVLRNSASSSGAHLRSRAEQRAHAACLSLTTAHLLSLLHRNDRLGMAAGIESRFPFLGRELTRLAINLPARYKLRWVARLQDRRHPFVTDKWVVRELAARRIPRNLAMRQKRGFPVRVHARLRVSPRLLFDGFLSQWLRLNQRAIETLMERGSAAWTVRLALVDLWGRMFFERMSIESATEHLHAHVTVDHVSSRRRPDRPRMPPAGRGTR